MWVDGIRASVGVRAGGRGCGEGATHIENCRLSCKLAHTKLGAVGRGDRHAVRDLGHAREGDVRRTRRDHRRVWHRDPQPLHPRRTRRHELAGSDGDAAGGRNGEAIGLGDLRDVDGGATAVDVVAHHIHRLIDPLPEDSLHRRFGKEHARGRDGIGRHKGGHATRQEHLFASDRVDDGVLDALRLPQVRVRRRAVALVIVGQEVLRLLEHRVVHKQRRRIGHLTKVGEAALEGRLVVPRARGVECRGRLRHRRCVLSVGRAWPSDRRMQKTQVRRAERYSLQVAFPLWVVGGDSDDGYARVH